MLREGSDFSEELVEKSWGKESANESGIVIAEPGVGATTVGSPHGFVIHGIEVLKVNENVTEVIDVENWRVDNSRVLRWIVSLFEWNSSVSSTKSSIQSTAGLGHGSTSLELEARVLFVVVDDWTGQNADIKDGVSVKYIMSEPLSPDRVFDFPVDELELHPAYDFFAPGPLPGVVADELMVCPIVDEIAKPIVEAEEQISNKSVTLKVSGKAMGGRSNRICDSLVTDNVLLQAMGGRRMLICDGFVIAL
ncbi:hypothetical protein Tco_1148240 [Tanacetum coccineum]